MSGLMHPKVRALRPEGGSEREVELWVVGVNHRTAPVDLREQLAFPEEDLGRAATCLLGTAGAASELVQAGSP